MATSSCQEAGANRCFLLGTEISDIASRHSPLNFEEQQGLFAELRANRHNHGARATLMSSYLHLVQAVIFRLHACDSESAEDTELLDRLVKAGNSGLRKAIGAFIRLRLQSSAFRAFSLPFIHGAVVDALCCHEEENCALYQSRD